MTWLSKYWLSVVLREVISQSINKAEGKSNVSQTADNVVRVKLAEIFPLQVLAKGKFLL